MRRSLVISKGSTRAAKRFAVLALVSVTTGVLAGQQRTNAATLSYSTFIPFQNTNWQQLVSLPKFAYSNGTLLSAQLRVTANVRTVFWVQNSGLQTMRNLRVNVTVEQFITASEPGLTDPDTPLVFAAKSFGPVNIAPGGFVKSDASLPNPPATLVNGPPYSTPPPTQSFALDNTVTNVVGYAAPAQLAALSGFGNISFDIEAFANTAITFSGGTANTSQLTYSDALVEVIYNFEPVPAPPAVVSLGIGGGVMGLAQTGMMLRRRRRPRKTEPAQEPDAEA